MTDVTDIGGHPTDALAAGEHMDQESLTRHVAGLATDEEVRQAERHLLLCRDCRHELVQTATRRRAEARRRRIRRLVPLTTAAALVLVVGTVLYRSGSPGEPVFRGDQVPEVFTAISPIGDQTVSADSVVFTWARAPGNAYYALTLTDAQGDVVWSTQATDTTASLPVDVPLEAGAYYWFVDAFLDGASSSTTGVQEFRVR